MIYILNEEMCVLIRIILSEKRSEMQPEKTTQRALMNERHCSQVL